ncbi:hypothetical protein KP509_1Z026000 [Ceratopteris richardii]|nr:hypothetical protein KP509_1Z026000 [Ceratopteris richardii]
MRSEMEDAVTVAHRFILLPCKKHKHCPPLCLPDGYGKNMDLPLHFFGVYDGHGGSQVSNICKEKLHLVLAKEIQTNADVDPSDLMNPQNSWEQFWETAMKSAFLTIDAHIEGYTWWNCASTESKCARQRVSEHLAPETVGSTAVVAVIGPSQIIVASCGDSRAVLSRGGQAIAMSTDHKPNREDELERIEAAGGKVFCWNGYRVFGVLAMSRAIGDRYLKPYIIAEPEVKCIPRSDDDDCLILASDGLWDVLKNEEVCDVACRCLARRVNATEVTTSSSYTVGSNGNKAEAALLTKMALARGSHDNISVVVVDLKERARS